MTVPGMGSNRGGGDTMAKIYVRWIKAGKMTIEDVPARWREQVEQMLEEDA